MGKEFWLKRWMNQEIGWHQLKVEPALISWASQLKPTKILVPLCGKTLDMLWLRDQGFEVVGVELSPKACQDFFSDHQIDYALKKIGEHELYVSPGITLINGDFFTLLPELVGKLGAVYDRAALIALPEKLRGQYCEKIMQLIGASLKDPEFKMLQIMITRSPHDLEGPPHSIEMSELQSRYEKYFNIELVSTQTTEKILYFKPKN